MPQSLSRVYVHITFSTKNRRACLDDDTNPALWAYIAGICENLECHAIRIGGYHDHIHICCLLSKKVTQVKLLEEIKKDSSKWMNTRDRRHNDFYWQEGYGIFSVNPSEIEKVVEYIDGQHERHKKCTFQEELLAFLKKYKVEYDERYLWN
ncbi:MAG: IS200/IS605 family transposase [Kiritimatiellaeota bacterium]|nr:IS200/IS605 family transposase [Kiritimatiellota bacterium]